MAATTLSMLVVLTMAGSPALADDADVTMPDLAGAAMTGLARDTEAGVYWVVKDPAKAVVTSIKSDGSVAGDLVLDQAVSDVQALAWREGTLLIGDIGGQREQVVVLRVTAPRNGSAQAEVLTLRYPDGAHQAAAMMVSPRGNIYLVTDGDDPAFYRPARQPVAGGVVDLLRVGPAPSGVTDGTFLSDGQQMALRTPIGVALFNAFTVQRVALGPTPDQMPGDALTESLDGGRLLVGYGGTLPRLSVMDYPSGVVTSSPQPSASSTSPSSTSNESATATSDASASANSAPATKAPSAAQGARGTLISLGVAAVIAALAGAATLIGRRR